MSDEGKVFKSKDNIAVPGAEIKDGKMVPNYVDVPVIASEAGEEYNIGPSHFSILVFRGTPRYTKFYGESLEAMQGGGISPKVIQEDIDKAEESLEEKIKIRVEKSLKDKIGADFVFLQDVLEVNLIDSSTSLTEVDEEANSFDFQVEAEASTITIKKDEIESFAEDFIKSKIPQDKSIYQNSLKIGYTPQVVDFETGKLILSLNISIKVYPKIELLDLKKSLVGKSENETEMFLENQKGLVDAQVEFWPFWVRSVPKDLDKIQIEYPIIN